MSKIFPSKLPTIEEIKDCDELDTLLDYLEKISGHKIIDIDIAYKANALEVCKNQIKILFSEEQIRADEQIEEYLNTNGDCEE